MNIQETRTKGIGNGFSVLNPADGYRQDNTLWFGECSECGERISSSLHDKGAWMHRLILWQDGLSTSSRQIDYCPSVQGMGVFQKWNTPKFLPKNL